MVRDVGFGSLTDRPGSSKPGLVATGDSYRLSLLARLSHAALTVLGVLRD